MSIFWDIRQDDSIGAAKSAAMRAEHSTERVRTEVNVLIDRVDRLTMICAAMWSMLQEHSGFSDDELMTRVQDIDLTDGRLDGQVRRDVSACAACQRPMAPRHVRCIYCGHPAADAKPFDAVF